MCSIEDESESAYNTADPLYGLCDVDDFAEVTSGPDELYCADLYKAEFCAFGTEHFERECGCGCVESDYIGEACTTSSDCGEREVCVFSGGGDLCGQPDEGTCWVVPQSPTVSQYALWCGCDGTQHYSVYSIIGGGNPSPSGAYPGQCPSGGPTLGQ